MITVTHNLGNLRRDNARWMLDRGRKLLRTTARTEYNVLKQRRGLNFRPTITVDGSRRKPIEAGLRIITIDVLPSLILNVQAVLRAIADKIYAVGTPTLTKRTGRLGQNWYFDVRRVNRRKIQAGPGGLPMNPGDVARFTAQERYAAPLTSLLAQNRLGRAILRRRARGLADRTYKRNPLRSRGLMSLLARALMRHPALKGFTAIGRFTRGVGRRAKVAVDIKVARLKGRRS